MQTLRGVAGWMVVAFVLFAATYVLTEGIQRSPLVLWVASLALAVQSVSHLLDFLRDRGY